MKPAISIADVLRAYHALVPAREEDKRAIAELLGFSLAAPMVSVAAVPPEEAPPPRDPARELQPRRQSSVPPAPISRAGASAAGMDFTVSGPQRRLQGPVPWSEVRDELGSPQAPVVPIEAEPLFEPRWSRAILSTALGVQAPIGRVNIREIAEEIARGRPLRRLPRLPGHALAPFVEVLLDVGDSMMPFMQDQGQLISALQKVAGADNMRVLKFTGSPLSGAGTDADEVWPEYSFPARGTSVLLLTDFGIGHPTTTNTRARPQEWRQFAAELRRRKIGCTAFVPYPRSRWPRELTRGFRTVEWDRTTTAGSVKFSSRPASG
jgi:hypothetical protein